MRQMVSEPVVFSWTARSLLQFFTGARRGKEELKGLTLFLRTPSSGGASEASRRGCGKFANDHGRLENKATAAMRMIVRNWMMFFVLCGCIPAVNEAAPPPKIKGCSLLAPSNPQIRVGAWVDPPDVFSRYPEFTVSKVWEDFCFFDIMG